MDPLVGLKMFSADGSEQFSPKTKKEGGQKPGVPREPNLPDRLERGHQVSVLCNRLGSSMMNESLMNGGRGFEWFWMNLQIERKGEAKRKKNQVHSGTKLTHT